MKVAKNKVVSIHYTLTSDKGEILDTSEGKTPLPYIHGTGQLIPGLEKELEGKEKNDEVKAVIAPEDAYGVYNHDQVFVVGKDGFQGDGVAIQNSISFNGKRQIPQLGTCTIPVEVEELFVRGDSDSDEKVSVSDVTCILDWEFEKNCPITILDAADSNDDDAVDISDSIYLLNWYYAGGPAPPQPYPELGTDPADPTPQPKIADERLARNGKFVRHHVPWTKHQHAVLSQFFDLFPSFRSYFEIIIYDNGLAVCRERSFKAPILQASQDLIQEANQIIA